MKNAKSGSPSFLNLQVIPFIGDDYMVIDNRLKKVLYATGGVSPKVRELDYNEMMSRFIAWDFIAYLTTGGAKPKSLINFGQVYAHAKKRST